MGNFDLFKKAFKAHCISEFGKVAQVIETLEPYKPPGPTPPAHARKPAQVASTLFAPNSGLELLDSSLRLRARLVILGFC